MLKKISSYFGSKKEAGEVQGAEDDAPTKPLAAVTPIVQEQQKIPAHTGNPQLIFGYAQSVGVVRDHNEDSILIFNTVIPDNDKYFSLGLFIVADGMGGHMNGEVASNLAVRIVARDILAKGMAGLLNIQPAPPEAGIQDILEQSVMEAHRIISSEAPGSGTTLTAVLIVGQQMSIAHVGDSRAYSINPSGKAEVLTRDHSLVKRMIELGHLTEKEAAVHPQRNVLYRALGQGEPFSPDINTSLLPAPGFLLLCSDGLWGVVPQEEMVQIIQSAPSPEIACQMLVDAANAAGGPDNISAILIRLPVFENHSKPEQPTLV